MQTIVLRWCRVWHRRIAILLFVFFLLLTVTGALLGWKKELGLISPTEKGYDTDARSWISIDSLQKVAVNYLNDSLPGESAFIDRIDVRPDKGIAKILFKDHYWGMQIDLTSGTILSLEKRHSDFVEDLHDGSIIDRLFGFEGEQVKLGYTAVTGISFLFLIGTGVWLWWGVKVRRKKVGGRILEGECRR